MTLLAGVWVDGSPHLMVTVTKRQSTPFCSTCDSLTCGHYKVYSSRKKDKNLPVSNLISSMANNPITDDKNAENLGDIDDDVEEAIDPAVGEEETQFRHYLDLPPPTQYNKMYGYNCQKYFFHLNGQKNSKKLGSKESIMCMMTFQYLLCPYGRLKKHVLTDFSLTPMMTVWF